MIVTMDGPAGSGKSTVAKLLAEKLSLYQVDSGAFYRWITHMALDFARKNSMDSVADVVMSDKFAEFLKATHPDVTFDKDGKQNLVWNGENMEKYIRHPEITANIKHVADAPFIRNYVNDSIRRIADRYSIIADGRDMGTVVFPDADFKFYLDASLQVRAKRRFSEFQAKNAGITLHEVEEQIARRDGDDQNRKFGKLQAASDAIFVDTTNLEINAVVQIITKTIQSKYPVI